MTGKHKPQARFVKATPATRFYECVYPECPDRSILLKMKRNTAGTPPLYHPACKERKDELRAEERRQAYENGYRDPRPNSPEERRNGTGPICGSPRGGDKKPCCLPAGWGTTHPGAGHCKFHFGNTGAHTVHAAKQMMLREQPVLGNPVSTDPHQAVLDEIQRTAGHVQWLNGVIQTMGVHPDSEQAQDLMDETGIVPRGLDKTMRDATKVGVDVSVWMKLYQSERAHLVKTCKMAVDMGCAERTVKLAEDQGRQIASVISKVLADKTLALTNVQRAAVPEIVRRELLAIEATATEVIPANATA